MTEPRKRGRKTKEEEAQDYLRSVGIDPAGVLKGIVDRTAVELPDDPAEIVEAFQRELYTQMSLGELKGTALVQGLKAVAILAEASKKDEVQDDGPERGLDEVLADAGLPVDRRREIGRRELGRLHAAAAALEITLERIGD